MGTETQVSPSDFVDRAYSGGYNVTRSIGEHPILSVVSFLLETVDRRKGRRRCFVLFGAGMLCVDSLTINCYTTDEPELGSL